MIFDKYTPRGVLFPTMRVDISISEEEARTFLSIAAKIRKAQMGPMENAYSGTRSKVRIAQRTKDYASIRHAYRDFKKTTGLSVAEFKRLRRSLQ
mgnify:CR=1 FL=1